MQLEDFYSCANGYIQYTRQQASDFAKGIAGDFNPIHDVDSKRFCVPGDLLFATAIGRYGISQQMRVTFSGMVGDSVKLAFPDTDADTLAINDSQGKTYLSLERSGPTTVELKLLADLTCCYVTFSGRTFPHILVPLMAEQQIMINPERPLVIYESMGIALDCLDFSDPRLELESASLNTRGKRGDVRLRFLVRSGDRTVGRGEKNMLLSGLRPFQQSIMDEVVADYDARKQGYRMLRQASTPSA
jgi:hypothetical protein